MRASGRPARVAAIALFVGAVLLAPVVVSLVTREGSGTPAAGSRRPAANVAPASSDLATSSTPVPDTDTTWPPGTPPVPATTPATTPAGSSPPPTTAVPVPTTVPPAPPPGRHGRVTTGVVSGPDGKPLAGAYVIGMDDLAVATTDGSGRYSMPCVHQPLVAATWLLPIDKPRPGRSGGWLFGVDTTTYGPPPTSPGPGYVFSGGASDLSGAVTVRCDGKPVDFQLPASGNVEITWRTASGADGSGTSDPIDNLYLPGLGTQAALETAPVSSAGTQVVDGLDAGSLRIDEVAASFSCTGATATGYGAEVTVVAGRTSDVTCTITGG